MQANTDRLQNGALPPKSTGGGRRLLAERGERGGRGRHPSFPGPWARPVAKPLMGLRTRAQHTYLAEAVSGCDHEAVEGLQGQSSGAASQGEEGPHFEKLYINRKYSAKGAEFKRRDRTQAREDGGGPERAFVHVGPKGEPSAGAVPLSTCQLGGHLGQLVVFIRAVRDPGCGRGNKGARLAAQQEG